MKGDLMNNSKIFITIFLVCGLLGMIRGIDPVSNNEFYFMHVNAKNDLGRTQDDLSISVVIYELGLRFKTSEFDLSNRDRDGKIVMWDVPSDIPSGEYWARITASNDDYRTVKHRPIIVV